MWSSSLSVMMQTETLQLSMRVRTSIEGCAEPVNRGSRGISDCRLPIANCFFPHP
jgi:hypothetical protein